MRADASVGAEADSCTNATLDIYSHVDDSDGVAEAIEQYAAGGKLLPL
jgi:hypothetical protein